MSLPLPRRHPAGTAGHDAAGLLRQVLPGPGELGLDVLRRCVAQSWKAGAARALAQLCVWGSAMPASTPHPSPFPRRLPKRAEGHVPGRQVGATWRASRPACKTTSIAACKHCSRPRRARPPLPLTCGTLPPSLLQWRAAHHAGSRPHEGHVSRGCQLGQGVRGRHARHLLRRGGCRAVDPTNDAGGRGEVCRPAVPMPCQRGRAAEAAGDLRWRSPAGTQPSLPSWCACSLQSLLEAEAAGRINSPWG